MIKNGDPENHADIVQLLIDRGVDLNALDGSSNPPKTALMLGMLKYRLIILLTNWI